MSLKIIRTYKEKAKTQEPPKNKTTEELYSDLQKTNQDLENNHLLLEEKITELKHELADNKYIIKDLKQESKRYKEQKYNIINQYEILEKKVNKISQSKNIASQNILREQKEHIANTDKLYEKVEKEYQKLEEKHQSLEAKYNTVNEEYNRLQSEINTLKATITNNGNNNSDEFCSKLELFKKLVEANNTILKENYQALLEKNIELEQTTKTLSDNVNSSSKQYKETIDKQSQELLNIENKIEELKTKYKKLESQYNNNTEVSIKDNSTETKNSIQIKIQEEIGTIARTANPLKNKTTEELYSDLQKTNQYLKNTHLLLEEKILELTDQLIDNKYNIKDLEKKTKRYKEQKHDIINKCKILKKRVNELSQSKNVASQDILKKHIANTDKLYEKIIKEHKRLEKKDRVLVIKYSAVNEEYNKLQTEINILKANITNKNKKTPNKSTEAKTNANNLEDITNYSLVIQKEQPKNIKLITERIEPLEKKAQTKTQDKEIKLVKTDILLSLSEILDTRKVTEKQITNYFKKAELNPDFKEESKSSKKIINKISYYTKDFWDKLITYGRKREEKEEKLSTGFFKNREYTLEEAIVIINKKRKDINQENTIEHINNNILKYEIYKNIIHPNTKLPGDGTMSGFCWDQIIYDMDKKKRKIEILSKDEVQDSQYVLVEHEAPLTLEQELHLGKIIQENKPGKEQAKKILVNCYLRYALKRAHVYIHRKVPINDIFQFANMGLILATEKYDYKRGFKFSGVANLYVRHKIVRGIEGIETTIRIPSHIYELHNKFKKIKREIIKDEGYKPSFEDVVKHLNLTKKEKGGLNLIENGTISLDQNLKHEDKTLEEKIEDRSKFTTEKIAENNAKKEAIENILKRLTKTEKYVIINYFGLNGGKKSLEEIGKERNVSRQRIGKIKNKALKKLQVAENSKLLEIFY